MSEMLLAKGSTAGSIHKNPHGPGATNNHDAIAVIKCKNKIVGGVICDGCGSMPHSEIGAKFGANRLAKIVSEQLIKNKTIDWTYITNKIVADIGKAAKFYRNNESLEDVIKNHYLFTAVILVACGDKFVIASCGDGVYMIDDKITNIYSLFENAPAYLAYNLLSSEYDQHPEQLSIVEQATVPISSISKGVVIGSDGLLPLLSVKYDDIHHPIFMEREHQFELWLRAQVFGDGVTLNDDVSGIIMRTREIQDKLFKEKNEIGILKNEIVKLKNELGTKKSIIVDLSSQVNLLKSENTRLKTTVKPTYIRHTSYPKSNQQPRGFLRNSWFNRNDTKKVDDNEK